MADELLDVERGSADPWLEQMLRYFDGDLNAAELAAFNAELRDDAKKRLLFAKYCTQSSLIRETFNPEKQAVQQREPYLPAQAKAHPKSRRWIRALAVAAVVAIAFLVGTLAFRNSPEPAVMIASLQRTEGDVRLLSANGQSQPVSSSARVMPGDSIRTHGAQSMAVLAYDDGTLLTLVGDANLTCNKAPQKSVIVHDGTLLASVARQPKNAPMLVSTASAQVQVLGTRFAIEAQAEQTDVKVTEGHVSVIRSSDGKRFDVSAGKCVVAGPNATSVVEDIKTPPDTWKVDFSHGIPQNWRGDFVNDNLPPGSRGAIKAIPSLKVADTFEIRSPDMWYNGIFSVHEDTYIYLRFKMEKPDWINIFLISRTIDEPEPESTNYLFNELKFWAPQPGKWRSIRIPLSRFGRAGSSRPWTLKSELPYLLLISSVGEDRGLTIDRIEVGRGAVKDVEYIETTN